MLDSEVAKLVEHRRPPLGLPELASDPRFMVNASRVTQRTELAAIITDRLATAGADHWFAAMADHDVPAGPINSIAEAFAFAGRLGLEPIVDIDGSPYVTNPIRLSRTPATYRSAPPPLGAAPTESAAE